MADVAVADSGPAVTGLRAVLPVVDADLAEACVASILAPDSACGLNPEQITVVDNTRHGLDGRWPLPTWRDPDGHNLGVARSWNVAAEQVLADPGCDYLVIMSASLLFGPELHTTWAAQMDTWWGAKVIEADGLSWHLIALHRTCLERVGLFDPAFYPAYFEQTDWCYRLKVIGWEQGFARVWVNALCQGAARHTAVVSCPARPLLDHYEAKWGGPKGSERFVLPYGSLPLDHIETEPVETLADRYGLEVWW